MLCKTILVWHHFEITFATEETLKQVGTWNKGNIYTVSLFLAQLFFWFSPFKIKSFCQPNYACELWQEWPTQILFAMILILMTQDYWTWVGGSNFCWKWLPWWHVKIRWWVLQICRNWWLRNIDVFPYANKKISLFLGCFVWHNHLWVFFMNTLYQSL